MYKYIKNDSNFYDLALELSEGNVKEAFCDIETTGLDCRVDKILLFQIMLNDQIYIFDFLYLNNEHLKYLINLLENVAKVTSVFHNTKFDIKFIAHNTGIWMKNVADTMNAEVMVNCGIGKSTYSLKELVVKYIGMNMEKESRELFYKQQVNLIDEQMLNYAAMDVKVLSDIYYKQQESLKQSGQLKVLEIENKILPVIAKMEYDGVLLDQDAWKTLDTKERQRLEKIHGQIIEAFIKEIDFSNYKDALKLAEAVAIPLNTKKKQKEAELLTTKELMEEWYRLNFNIASPKQMKTALNLVGIDVDSTDKKVLKKLKSSEIIDTLLEKSECSKRISTYGLSVLEFIHPLTGRIHTEFLDIGAATGRLSSGNPLNLQNIPTADGYRESFIASPEFDWLSLDYSQQEFRLAGAISGERKIIDAYLQGADMHTAAASIIYNKPLKDINKKERFVGKTANFTLIYGGTEWALARNLDLTNQQSTDIITQYKKGFPTFWAFKEASEAMILKLGYSTTPMGRKRYFPQRPLYMNGNEYVKFNNKIKREGFNMIIQGGAADITKIAMVNAFSNNSFDDKLRLLIQVHDELDAEGHKSISRDAAEFVKEEMLKAEQPFLGEIPAAVDIKIGEHWIH